MKPDRLTVECVRCNHRYEAIAEAVGGDGESRCPECGSGIAVVTDPDTRGGP